MGKFVPILMFDKMYGIPMPPPDNRPRVTSGADERHLMREATEWFMRQAASNFSPEQRAQFEAWRQKSSAHDRAYRRVSALWDSPELNLAARRAAISADGPPSGRWFFRRWSMQVRAAAVAATILMISLAAGYRDIATWLQADYATGVGERRMVTLPDQSTATLNTDSSIAVQYGENGRLIRLLHGEAAFSVQSDAHRPFTVETHGVEATALGTQFVVRDRTSDVQVTVLHGSVKVAGGAELAAHGVQPVQLASGDQVVVGAEGPGSVTHVDAASSAAWMQDRLVFVRVPLSEVVKELSRYHRGYITVWNSELHTLPVTGIYNLKDPARVVTTLADTLPIQVIRLTDRVIVIR